MNINGKWYTESEIQAYAKELESKLAELEAKHHNECGQIAHYDDELTKAKELLKSAVEDLHEANDCMTCDKYGNRNECFGCCGKHYVWYHEAEALALIGEDGEQNDD